MRYLASACFQRAVSRCTIHPELCVRCSSSFGSEYHTPTVCFNSRPTRSGPCKGIMQQQPPEQKPVGCFVRGNGPGPWGRFVEGIASKLAFFPPDPPSYEVKEHKDASRQLYVQPVDRTYPRVPSARVRVVRTPLLPDGGGGQDIVTAFLAYKDARGRGTSTTLLCSHGNAVDLGQMLPLYRELSHLLAVNVMAYDYAGYGASTGLPSTANTRADISAVLAALQEHHDVAPCHVVLYGQSVGSGPTVWLAAQDPGVAGVVLHSPLLSGVRVLRPTLKYWPAWADIYPNHLLVGRIQVPLLVLHGTADDVIHISCARRLVELAGSAAVEPLWAAGYDHQNVETHPEYIPRLRRFLDQLFPPAGSKSGAGAGAVPGAPGSTPRSLSGRGADAAAAVRPQPPGPGA